MANTSWAQMRQQAANAPKQGGAAIPAGSYPAYIETAQYKTAKSGADMIEVVFRVMGGEYDGKGIFNNFVLSPDSPQALDIFFRHMEALGIPGATIDQLPEPPSVGLAYLAQLLVNRQGVIVLGFGKGDYAHRNEVKDVKATNDPAAMAHPVPGQAGAPAVPGIPPAAPPMAPPQAAPAPAPVPQVPQVPAVGQPVPQGVPAPQPGVPAPGPAPVPPQPGVIPAAAPAPAAPAPAPVAPAPAPAPAPVQAPPVAPAPESNPASAPGVPAPATPPAQEGVTPPPF